MLAGQAPTEPGLTAKAVLIIAHPGHELCVHGWLARVRPEVCVLTDGSGRQGIPRLSSTTRNLTEAGARPGSFYGRLTDQAIYQALLTHDLGFFTSLAAELAGALTRGGFRYVVGDALEGYNPTHDICRLVIDAAVEIARRSDPASPLENFDFALIGPTAACPRASGPDPFLLRLDEVAYRRKIEAMRACPELSDEVSAGLDGADLRVLDVCGDLADEVKELLKARGGAESFRLESLRPVRQTWEGGLFDDKPPFYERYGEKLVSAGLYRRAIRYREHFKPMAEALRHFAAGESKRG